MCDGPVIYESKKHAKIGADSSGSEYMALFYGTKSIVKLRNLITQLQSYPKPIEPTICLGDNDNATRAARGDCPGEFAKTLRLKFDWSKEQVDDQQITTARVGTADNVSDIYTKPVKTGVWRALYLKAKGYESPWRPDTETATQHQ